MLFESALGARWARMPEVWREFHTVTGSHAFEGVAQVSRGQGVLARIAATAFRFPPETDGVPLRVEMARVAKREHWTRIFGSRRFSSVLSPAREGHFRERFGPFSFLVRLTGDEAHLGMEVVRGSFLGVPLPAIARPNSTVREDVRDGRFNFDVEITHPACGRIVRYQGWLAPVDARG